MGKQTREKQTPEWLMRLVLGRRKKPFRRIGHETVKGFLLERDGFFKTHLFALTGICVSGGQQILVRYCSYDWAQS